MFDFLYIGILDGSIDGYLGCNEKLDLKVILNYKLIPIFAL